MLKQILDDLVISSELMLRMHGHVHELRVFLEGLSKDELEKQFHLAADCLGADDPLTFVLLTEAAFRYFDLEDDKQ